ncbi:hypothetical protein D1007_52326 [Hordeum vulgare]|nr:hypothetical protein D1007_52326 [Hordeum vulgare]
MAVKESMKLYFLIRGEELVNGLIFLNDDNKCVQMADDVSVGAVADLYVEYHGEEDSVESSSGGDFEDEFVALTDSEPDVVIIAAEPAESDTDVIITNETGVVTQVMCNPLKHRKSSGRNENVDGHTSVSQMPLSQVFDPTQQTVASREDSGEDSDSDFVYIPHSDDSGEDSDVVELRRHARKFKKRMRDSKSWIGRDASVLKTFVM